MKLSVARELYHKSQEVGVTSFVVQKHCWVDHPERRFTKLEVLELLLGKGHLRENHFPSAQPHSFLWQCRDIDGNPVDITVLIQDQVITVQASSAYRQTKFDSKKE